MRPVFLLIAALLTTSLCVTQLAVRAQEPVDAEVYVDRAILAFEARRYDDALKELDDALGLNPESVEALYYKSRILTVLDRKEEAAAALEKARAFAPTDMYVLFELGVLRFGQGEYEKAEPLLEEVFDEQPKRPNLGFYLGVIEYRKKNYRTALDFLGNAVPSDDTFAQLVAFYTGLAKGNLGFSKEAASDLKQALTIRPSSALGDPAKRFAELLDERAQAEKPFHGSVRFGIFYDTNPAVLPDDSGDVVVRSILAGTGNEKSAGQVIESNLSYTFLRSVDWEGSISHRFYQTLNNAIPKLNLQSNAPKINFVRKGAIDSRFGNLKYSAGVQGSYEYLSLGNAPFLNSWFFNPYFSLVENPSNITFFQYRFRYRDFSKDGEVIPSERRSGPNYMVGAIHYLTFAEGRHFVNAGYQFDFDDTHGGNWRNYGNRLLAGFQYSLPWWALRYRFQMDLQWRNYTDKNTLLDLNPSTGAPATRRNDFEMMFFSSLNRDFKWFSQKFTVALDYLYDQNFSNLGPYAYKRHVVTTSVTWSF